MTTSSYKGRDVFNTTAGSLYVSMGGRDQEMTFGIGKIGYTDLYGSAERTIAAATGTVDGPNKGAKFNLAHLPSDAVVVKEYGKATATGIVANANGLTANKTFVLTAITDGGEEDYNDNAKVAGKIREKADVYLKNDSANTKSAGAANMALNDVVVVTTDIAKAGLDNKVILTEVNATSNAFQAGEEYEIVSFGTQTATVDVSKYNEDVAAIARAVTSISDGAVLTTSQRFTVDKDASIAELAHLNALSGQMTFRKTTDTLTKDIEAIQGLLNTARVQAGSQYAALESAVNYTTDLTAQYELGYNTVNDVNFSMETAHLAKNQILQQAATAMLAQANQGQQGLLQLIS
jgi:flagellin